MILVNAANGQQGRRLVPALLAAGQAVRGCVRSEASAAELRAAGAEALVGDITDPDLITRALRGVDRVYHVCPGIHPREREIGFAWIDAARAAGVKHFVFSSVLHAIIGELPQHRIKRDIEEHLIGSHLEYTILQPTIYMAPRRFTRAFQTGVLTAGWSLDRAQSLVDVGDIAQAAASILSESASHAGATYELAAAGRYTAHDMAAIIARVLGKPIAVEQIGPEAYLKGLFGDRDLADIPHEASVSRSLTQRYSSHDFIGNANVLRWLLGREPTSFEDFVTAYRDTRQAVPRS